MVRRRLSCSKEDNAPSRAGLLAITAASMRRNSWQLGSKLSQTAALSYGRRNSSTGTVAFLTRAHNPRSLWNSPNVLLHSENADPHFTANEFATFFHIKVKTMDTRLNGWIRAPVCHFVQLTAVAFTITPVTGVDISRARTLPEQAVYLILCQPRCRMSSLQS